jgi:predicted RecA/RadA family phage recombinase
MKTFSEEGEVLAFTAPGGGVTKGVPYLIGSLVVVPVHTAAEGARFSGLVRGVVSFTKTGSQAWTEGCKVYLDVSPKEFTTSAGGNTLCGVAVVATGSGAGELTGVVRLDGVVR